MLKVGDNLTVSDIDEDGNVLLYGDNGRKFWMAVDPSDVADEEDDDEEDDDEEDDEPVIAATEVDEGSHAPLCPYRVGGECLCHRNEICQREEGDA